MSNTKPVLMETSYLLISGNEWKTKNRS